MSPDSPEGMSSANTGRPQRLTASIAKASSGRTGPLSPGAEDRIDDHVATRQRRAVDQRLTSPAAGDEILPGAARIAAQALLDRPPPAPRTSRPAAWAKRASVKPSPALLPVPQTITTWYAIGQRAHHPQVACRRVSSSS